MASERLDVILRLITGDYKKEAKEAAVSTSQIGTAAKTSSSNVGIFGQNIEGVNKKLKGLATGALLGVAVGFVKLGKDAVESLARIERIGAQTEAVIRSTGGAANVTREQIDDYATALENLTSVEAESITEGQNLLLTFTKIRNEAGEGNDIFDQTTKIMVDMSVAMGTDAAGSAIQLGKALNDPVAGITALTRVGVTFTKEQKETIASLVEMGDVLGAQKIILAELNTEFGGSAEALGDTLTGRIAKASDAFGDLGESLMSGALPAVEDLILRATELFDTLGPMSAAAATAKATLASLATDGIDVLAQKVPAAVTALQATFEAMGPGLDETERMAEVLGVLNQQLEFSASEWGDLREAVASGRVDLDLSNVELEVLIGLLVEEEAALATIGRSGHAHAVDEITDAQFRLGQETSATTDEIKAQRDEVRAALDPLFALRKSADDNRDAQIALAAAIREFGPASIQAKDAGLALLATQADLNYYAELYAANFGPAQAEAFRELGRQAGLADEQVEAIIASTDALNNKQVNVFITMHESVIREAIEDNLIGGMASGGKINGPKFVGEAGVELFIPNTSGSIVSNKQLMAALGTTNSSRTMNNYFAKEVKPSDLQFISLMSNLETLVS